VKKWENESNGCVSYQCNDESGIYAKPNCKNNDNITICVDGKCIEESSIKDKKWKVEIEMKQRMMLMTPDEIAIELSKITDIDVSDMIIGIENNEDTGFIKRIIIYVKDETRSRYYDDDDAVLFDDDDDDDFNEAV